MTTFVALMSFAAGGVLIWFAKENIQALAIGGKAVIARLEARASALKARLGGL
jgi:hypothetical protein